MTTNLIEALIRLRGEDVDLIADSIGEPANRVSETINYSRLNARIRKKLADHFNLPEEYLFDQPVGSAASPRRTAAVS